MDKNISLKKYFVLILIIIISIAFVIYFYLWYSAYENKKLNTPILNDYLNVIQYNEFENYLVENKDAIIYVSALNNVKIREFEKKFKRLIIKYSINNSILYLDITNELQDNRIYKEINEKYSVNIPYVITFNNGNVSSIFNIKDNEYDIDRLKEYLVRVGVIND